MWRKHHFGLLICLVSRHVLWLQELHNKHLLVQWFFSSYFLFWTPKQIEPPKHLQSLYLGWAFSLQLLSVPPNYQARCCSGPLHLTVHLEEIVFSQRATFLTATSLLDLWSDVLLSVRMPALNSSPSPPMTPCLVIEISIPLFKVQLNYLDISDWYQWDESACRHRSRGSNCPMPERCFENYNFFYEWEEILKERNEQGDQLEGYLLL